MGKKGLKTEINNKKRKREKIEGKSYKPKEETDFEFVYRVLLPERPVIMRHEEPVSWEIWNKFKTFDGQVYDIHKLKSYIFRGGIEKALRPYLWKYLLNYLRWENTDEENRLLIRSRTDRYYALKRQWENLDDDQVSRFGDFKHRRDLIWKDVARTDRSHPFFSRSNDKNLKLLKDILTTYVMYDFDLGYVQGMSDILAPILLVMENEVDAFWCFVGLMDRVHQNFEMDQKHIQEQLSNLKHLIDITNPKLASYLEHQETDHMCFCFRWILVAFKREFSFDDILHFWEILWTDIPCKNFLLLFCVAILDQQMDYMIENKFGVSEVLKHINNLSMRIDLNKTLCLAEAIYHQLAAVQDKLPYDILKILSFVHHEEPVKTPKSPIDLPVTIN